MARKTILSGEEVTRRRFIDGKPEMEALVAQAHATLSAARAVYEARTATGLSQRELARRVGTSAAQICRLENDDYEGHTLAALSRIAHALGKRVEVRFVDAPVRSEPEEVELPEREPEEVAAPVK